MSTATSTQAYTGHGVVFSINTGTTAAPVWTPIAQLNQFSFSGSQLSFEDITNAGSPMQCNVVLKEQMRTTMDPGTMELQGFYLPEDTGQQALSTAFNGATLNQYKLVLQPGPGQSSTGNSYTFGGYVKSMPVPDINGTKVLTLKVSITITTAITLTLGA